METATQAQHHHRGHLEEELAQPWRFFYKLWYYLVTLPVAFLVVTPFLAFCTYVLSFFSSRVAVYMGVVWAKVLLALTIIRTRVFGQSHVDPNQSYVIVVNHESNLDILAIYGYLPVDFRWVMKIEIRKIPFIGGACARMKHVYVDRSNRDKALASLQKAREQLVGGTSILFFPEGTRSKTRELLPFKKGAFRMAIDLNLPILPVTLRDTGLLMPARGVEARRPGTLGVMIHEPISVEGLTPDDLPDLMAHCRNVIDQGRSAPDPTVPLPLKWKGGSAS